MTECVERSTVVTGFCLLISVLQMITRQTVQGKSIQLDVSRIRINPLECYDRSKSCAKEAKHGYCESNYHYMIDRCPWSCRFCRRLGGDTEKCKDISKHCAKWVRKKECATRPDYMAQNCKKSCQMCGPESYFKVTDTDSSCSVWAKAGWCQAITDLLDKCPHSCQKYGVQGASSLEERYITVNFRDSSSLAAPTFSEIVAPPPPPGGISPQSDINLLPPDLRVALANEWWDSTLFKLTQKQNEYVTHPEPRPHPISLKKANSTQLTLTGNETTKITHANKTTGDAVKHTSKIDFSEKGEMLAVSASAPPPRAYDALLPKLFLSNGPSWTKTEMLKNTNQKVEVNHKEDNDEVVDKNGQQKAEVPLVELEKEYEQSGISNMDTAMSSGSGLMVIDGGNEDLMVISSKENEAQGDETSGKNETISLLASGSGEEEQYVSGEETKEQDVSGEIEENNAEGINPWGFTNVLSGSGEDNTSRRHRISLYSSGNGPQSRERIEIVSPDHGFSGSGQIEAQDTSSAFEDSSSGSDQYEYQ